MTGQAQDRPGVVHDQKVSELIVMRVMTRGALKFAVVIQLNAMIQRRGILEIAIRLRELGVVNKRDGMVPGKIGSQVGLAHRHG